MFHDTSKLGCGHRLEEWVVGNHTLTHSENAGEGKVTRMTQTCPLLQYADQHRTFLRRRKYSMIFSFGVSSG